MSVLHSAAYRDASRRVMSWGRWYTRDLDGRTATQRRDELASDLHEEAAWAESVGRSAASTRLSILGRALRGAPADLAWRRQRLRATAGLDLGALRLRAAGSTLLATVVLLGVALTGLGGVLTFRIVRALLIGDLVEITPRAIAVVLLGAVASVATAALARPALRGVGAAVLAVIALVLGLLGLDVLYTVSASTTFVVFHVPATPLLVSLAGLGLALVFSAAALWWWPSRGAHRVSLPTPHPRPVRNASR